MTNRVVEPATTTPISLAEARAMRNLVAYVGSPATHPQDAVLELGIAAAVEFMEHQTQLSIGVQTREEVLDAFPDFEIALPFGPVHSVESVKYDDENGDEQTLDVDGWVLDAVTRPAVLLPAYGEVWPATIAAANAVRVRYVAGYTNGASPDDYPTPATFKLVAHLFAGHYYENREAVSQGSELKEIPLGVDRLLFPFRRVKVA